MVYVDFINSGNSSLFVFVLPLPRLGLSFPQNLTSMVATRVRTCSWIRLPVCVSVGISVLQEAPFGPEFFRTPPVRDER